MYRAAVAMALLVLTAGLAAQAPSPDDPRPMFDVTSVKPYKGDSTAMSNRLTPRQTIYANVPLGVLIQSAYGVARYQVVDAPAWVHSERWDVVGTVTAGDARAEARERMQRLLEDRFGLRVRRDKREMPVYRLFKARPGGPLGPGLRPSSLDCSPRPAPSPCGTRVTATDIEGISDWALLSLPLLLGLDRPVVDETGLSGQFDVKLEWTSDLAVATDNRVSVFTALEEQLGLRLESARASIDVLVIEQVQRPMPD